MNVLSPMNEAVLNGGLSLFTKVSVIMTGLVSVIFMMRIALNVVKVASMPTYGELLQDVVFYFGATSLYPLLVKFLVVGVGGIALKIAYVPHPEVQSQIYNFFDRMFSDFAIMSVFGSIGDLIFVALAQSIYTALISIFIAAAPIFIFLSTMLGLQTGLRSYFGILISLCLWPVMWILLGQLSVYVGAEFAESPISSVVFWLVIQGLQLLSPLFTFGLFKNMSTGVGLAKVAVVGRMMV